MHLIIKFPKTDCMNLQGERILAKMAHSGALTPCFVNNDYVTVEINHSTAHARPEVLSWSWAGQHAPVSFTAKALAAAALGRHWSDTIIMLYEVILQLCCGYVEGFPGGQRVCLPNQETRVRSLGQEDPLEKEMATLSSILAWRIPWTEEPGGLLSMGLQESETT